MLAFFSYSQYVNSKNQFFYKNVIRNYIYHRSPSGEIPICRLPAPTMGILFRRNPVGAGWWESLTRQPVETACRRGSIAKLSLIFFANLYYSPSPEHSGWFWARRLGNGDRNVCQPVDCWANHFRDNAAHS